MAKELITMSEEEVDRLRILHRVMDRQLTQVYGASLLEITDRQVRNLLYKIRDYGDRGIAHGRYISISLSIPQNPMTCGQRKVLCVNLLKGQKRQCILPRN